MRTDEILKAISDGDCDEQIHLVSRAAHNRLRQVQEEDYLLLKVGDEIEVVDGAHPEDGARGVVARINRNPGVELPVTVRLHGRSRECFADRFSLRRLRSTPKGDAGERATA